MSRVGARARLSVEALAFLAAVLNGCGDSNESETGRGERTFVDDDLALTFGYPDDPRPEEVALTELRRTSSNDRTLDG